MSYGLKYTHDFNQIKDYGNSSEWQIQIHLEGYGGSVSTFNVDRGSITLSREGDVLETIQGTKFTFSIINTSEGEFKEFRTADWGDYKVVLIKDPNGTPLTKFIGYNQSEIYTEPYDQPPYSSVLEFTCGLNHLKHVKWDDSNNEVEETGKDANSTSTVSASVVISGTANAVSFIVSIGSGAHNNHIITLQTSVDDSVWVDTIYNVPTDLNTSQITVDLNDNFARLKVTTAEGASSLIDWTITPFYVGQKSMIEVIRLALNKLPSPLPIREIVNLYEDSTNETTTDSMLNQIFVDSSAYKKKSDEGDEGAEEAFDGNKTLEDNLKVFLVNVYQANGIWYIVRVQEYIDTTIYFRDFNANVGSEGTISIDGTGNFTTNEKSITGPTGSSNELVLVAPESELSIEPPLNRVQVTYSQINIDQVSSDWVKNGCWEDKIISGGNYTPSFWNFTGGDPSTYPSLYYDANTNGFQAWMMEFNPSTQVVAETFQSGIYIEQTKTGIPTSTLDSLLFNFKTYFAASFTGTTSPTPVINWVNNSLEVIYEVEIQVGVYYLHGDIDTGYSWVASTGRATFKYMGGYAGNIGSSPTSFAYGVTWWREISQSLPTLPQTAFVDIRIRIYQPYSNCKPFADSNSDYTLASHRISQTCFELVYLPIEASPTEELILYSNITEDENLEEIEVLHADGTNTGTLNSFRTSNGLITDNWNRRGVTDNNDILTLFLKQIGDTRGDFVKELSAKVIGELDVFNTIKHTTDVVTQYYIKTYSWAIETSEYDFTLTELGISPLPITIVKEPIIAPVNPDPIDPTENNPIGFRSSPTSDGSVVAKSSFINPNQGDLNDYI